MIAGWFKIRSVRSRLRAILLHLPSRCPRANTLALSGPRALRAILDHHQREEIEHFAMLLEWCRRNDADFAEQLRTYMFTEGDILNVEDEATEAGLARPKEEDVADAVSPQRSTIGALKEER